MSANQLDDALEQLVASELVFRRGTPPEATYSFKHALVQDAAYQSLLKSKRQQLHAHIAEALERQFPEIGDTQPEVLARHFTDGGLGERAIPYWRRAGEMAAGRSANVEAIAHLSKGLDLVQTLPDTPQRLEEELALLVAIGGPLIAKKGYPAPEVERTYSRAWTLCDQLGRSSELFPVLRGLWNCHQGRGELRQVYELAERLVVLGDEQGTPVRRALARRTQGTALFLLGRFADATAPLNEAISMDDAVGAWEDPAHLLLYTERAGVVCRLYSAWNLWFLGFPDRALEWSKPGWRSASASCMPTASRLLKIMPRFCIAFDASLLRHKREPRRRSNSRASTTCRTGSRRRPFAEGLLWSVWASRSRDSPCFAPALPTGTGPVPMCLIPNGWVSSPKPIFGRASSKTRLTALDRATEISVAPARATIKQNSTG